jgi:hypothetical protein
VDLIKKILIISLVFLAPVLVEAVTYTVDGTNGTDSGTCVGASPSTECKTIQYVFDNEDLDPGDIVEVEDGTYDEQVVLGSDDAGDSNDQLIFREKSGHTAIIDDGDSDRGTQGIVYLSGSNDYVTISGFTVQGFGYSGIDIAATSGDKSTGVVISSNTVSADNTGASQFSVKLKFVDRVTINNNIIEITSMSNSNQTDCMFIAQTLNAVIEDNTIRNLNTYDNPATGHNDVIQVVGGQGTGSHPYNGVGDFTIRNNLLIQNNGSSDDAKQQIYFEYEVIGTNLIYNNVVYRYGDTQANQISVANKGNGTNGSFAFYNNTLFSSAGSGAGINIAADCGTLAGLKNNIVDSGAGRCVIIQCVGVTKANVENNEYYSTIASDPFRDDVGLKTWSEWTTAGWDDDYSNWNEPDFVDTTYPADLSLNSGDPAIDDGADLSGIFSTDIDGTSRHQGYAWDIGAYEHLSGSSVNKTIEGVSITP